MHSASSNTVLTYRGQDFQLVLSALVRLGVSRSAAPKSDRVSAERGRVQHCIYCTG